MYDQISYNFVLARDSIKSVFKLAVFCVGQIG